ncbi:BZ3500_MvSof-1268-A1-R1_Chr6-3g08957 [Microbotryum saponariae]|uniref:BZ3500_MvSof-1268-A1-R1_Chr6-3g08957 protein n=1 Tax=Microbotryum saponariae TaxID=289078 RepID=A0A2X0LNL0_9BASI|nr:BZ3500_MvSof-1268-A1-R1_Chr6-3g08957 [Microbotryum saponariae]SDA07559.1 BZ3501_MvSof-1269-A2-R1_Chr6-2g08661 [Microbotryum saponariae]
MDHELPTAEEDLVCTEFATDKEAQNYSQLRACACSTTPNDAQKVAAPKTTGNSLKGVINEDPAKKSQDEPADDTTTTSTPPSSRRDLASPPPHTKTLTVGTTTAKTSASLLFAPISDGKSHVADVGPSAGHAASTHLESEASHALHLEDSVRKQAPSENGTKRKRAWGVADEVDEVNTESEKVDTKPDSSSSRLNLSSESDNSDASGDGDGSDEDCGSDDKDGNVPSETALGEAWSKIAKTKVICSDVDDEPDDTFELKGAHAHMDNPCKVSCDRCDHPPRFAPLTRVMTHCSLASTVVGLPILQSSTEEPDAKSLEDELDQIRRELQALRAMLEPVITFINTPSIDHLKNRLPPAVKVFVATPYFYKQLASAESFAMVLTKSGIVPVEACSKNITFRQNLLSNIPALLVQGRSDLLRHINKAQKDKATLGHTMQQWYKGQQVAITQGHVICSGGVYWCWQAMKAPNILDPKDSKANSFANKLKRYGDSLAKDAATAHLAGGYKRNGGFDHQTFLFDMVTVKMKRHSGIRTAGQNTLSEHTIQAVCSEVVGDPANNLSFASRVADAVQEMGFASGKARKTKKTKTTKDEKQIEDGQP